MEIISYKKKNHLYLAFQDFNHKEDDIYKKLKIFPIKSQKTIRNFLEKNIFSDTLKRQTHYLNTISTYIEDMYDDETQYFFHLYIFPKDLIITNLQDYKDDELIKKIEFLSTKLFYLYSKLLNTNEKAIKLFNNYKGKNFLQLESEFYIHKLGQIYSYLINYNANHQMKIVCSDKRIGIEIDSLNILESNPLKNYQFIKMPHQQELVRFIYSLIDFLKIYRIEIFKLDYQEEYEKIIKLTNKITNLLLKISSRKYLINDNIKKENLLQYFSKYKNKKELQQNKHLYKIVKSIFLTQLEEETLLFKSIDLTKIFEKIVELKLSDYNNVLYIGDENNKIITPKCGTDTTSLNSVNFLINKAEKPKQYPDFLIKDPFYGPSIYHIIDAKYKLFAEKKLDSHDIRQILSYSILFNKEYSQQLTNQKNIKKFIIYAKQSYIDLNNIENLTIDESIIDISSSCVDCSTYIENLFNSELKYIGINTIKEI